MAAGVHGLIMTSPARISENPRKRAYKIKMSRSDQLLGGGRDGRAGRSDTHNDAAIKLIFMFFAHNGRAKVELSKWVNTLRVVRAVNTCSRVGK